MSQHKTARGGASSKGKKAGKTEADEKQEDVLQAVVIADSFQKRFAPFAVEKPRCLLPLANTPLIEYTLEFLAMNGVQEVFIYCGAHQEQIEQYIQASRWSPIAKACPFSSLEFIRVADAGSIGDFLRDLDKRNVIQGDFILVHGDLVANLSLDSALAAHRSRREASRDSCMTMVLREAGEEDHSTKTKGITPVFVVDPRKKRCLHYEEMHPFQTERHVGLDPSVLENSEAEVRTDLIDAQIDICTPDILALWSESFDYDLPRANFLHGVLKDWELNGKMIHTEIVSNGYCARASNLQMYDAISRDILGGWTYPFAPDLNLLKGQSYRLGEQNVYQEDDVVLDSDCSISDAVVGRDTQVGSQSMIQNSIIGRNCQIGSNVRIIGSFIWGDVVIDDWAVVEYSVVADMATIGKGCSINPGSLLSFGVRIHDGVQVNASSVLAVLDHNGDPVNPQSDIVGPKGKGALYRDPEDDEIDADDPSGLQKSLIYSLDRLDLYNSSVSTLAEEDELSEDEDDAASHFQSQTSRSRLSSFASDESGGANASSFHSDAVTGLLEVLRGVSGNFDAEKLEFASLRFANNASDVAMRRAVATAFVRRGIELMNPENGGLEPVKAAKQALTSREGAVDFISDVGVGSDAVSEQVEFALAMQKACASSAAKLVEATKAGNLLAAMLQQMYDLDILEEEGILGWWGDSKAKEGETMTALRDRCQALVEWLENADEESDDD